MEVALQSILNDVSLATKIASKTQMLRALEMTALHECLMAEGVRTMGQRARCVLAITDHAADLCVRPMVPDGLVERFSALLTAAGLDHFCVNLCPLVTELLAIEDGRALQAALKAAGVSTLGHRQRVANVVRLLTATRDDSGGVAGVCISDRRYEGGVACNAAGGLVGLEERRHPATCVPAVEPIANACLGNEMDAVTDERSSSDDGLLLEENAEHATATDDDDEDGPILEENGNVSEADNDDDDDGLQLEDNGGEEQEGGGSVAEVAAAAESEEDEEGLQLEDNDFGGGGEHAHRARSLEPQDLEMALISPPALPPLSEALVAPKDAVDGARVAGINGSRRMIRAKLVEALLGMATNFDEGCTEKHALQQVLDLTSALHLGCASPKAMDARWREGFAQAAREAGSSVQPTSLASTLYQSSLAINLDSMLDCLDEPRKARVCVLGLGTCIPALLAARAGADVVWVERIGRLADLAEQVCI